MKKTLVVSYSRTGNNRYLAERIAGELGCEIEYLKPVVDGLFPVIITSLVFPVYPGNRPLKHRVSDYDRIIVCGPIWMGQFLSPMRSFVTKYRNTVKSFCFATCCGSSDKDKDGKFGYNHVFGKIRKLLGEKCGPCQAFPIILALPEDKRSNDDEVMKARLSDDNFTGELKELLDSFVSML